MRFPGDRNPKHYFPVTEKATRVIAPESGNDKRWYVVGLDEVLIDIEVSGTRDQARALGLVPGESVQLSPDQHRCLLSRLDGTVRAYAAGGTVANTLNNYTYLSGEPAILLGSIEDSIRPGSPAFAYVAQTAPAVDLTHVVAAPGPTGTAITFIDTEGERSFGVAPGISGDYPAVSLPEVVVRDAAVVLTSLYCLRPPERAIAKAALRMMSIAKEAGVPVAFGLGTAGLVRERRQDVRELLAEYVTIAAMNVHEAEALTGESDALLAARKVLNLIDCVVITEGARGLTMAGYTDEQLKRQTREPVRSKSIPEYNRWEYSRLMRRRYCERPVQVFSHIHPYRGGPDRLRNTSGAGDAALAALLHDVAANYYHRTVVPDSDKHPEGVRFLTYSSLSRNAQYGNRVAYEVLKSQSPRLTGPVGHDDDTGLVG